VFVFVNLFIQTISTAPLQVHYYSEALPTQHEYYTVLTISYYNFHAEAP